MLLGLFAIIQFPVRSTLALGLYAGLAIALMGAATIAAGLGRREPEWQAP